MLDPKDLAIQTKNKHYLVKVAFMNKNKIKEVYIEN